FNHEGRQRLSNRWVGCSSHPGRVALRVTGCAPAIFRSQGSRSLYPPLLMVEQPFLPPQTAAVPAERPVSSNHAVARDDDANHVSAIRATDCTTRIFISQAFCHPRIRTRFSNWNLL